jgi:hypothetical protein
MEFSTILWLAYLLPIPLNFLLLYYDKDVKTYGDLLNGAWLHILPVVNIFISLLFISDTIFEIIENKMGNPTSIIKYKWEKFKNTEIKK